jgi:hypothetical protein
MSIDNRPERADDGRIRFLRCSKCGKDIGCSPIDLLNYMRTGWPKCCQETMILFIEHELANGEKT